MRIAAIATICLLCKIAFVEGDYGAAEHHCRALSQIASGRLQVFPGFLWLFLVWADLRLTAVLIRKPYLPYYLHPDFNTSCYLELSNKAAHLIAWNMLNLPKGPVFSVSSADKIQLLFTKLHRLAVAYETSELEWTVPWGISYDVAYLLAELQVEIEQHGSSEEMLVLLGCQMQFWGMSSPFVPQSGIRVHQVSRLAQIVGHVQPAILCERWLEQTGSIDLLLWALLNAVASLVFCGRLRHVVPGWLRHHIAHIVGANYQCTDEDGLEALMRRMPYTERWNGMACREWRELSQTEPQSGPSNTIPSNGPDPGLFANLRLTFDSVLPNANRL